MNMQMRNHFFRPGNALRLSAALLLAALAAGCAKEPDSGIRGTELLVVGTALENPAKEPSAAAAPSTRAAETNGIFTFGDGDALGLFMRGAAYADVDNRKVVYTKPGSAAGTWAIEGSPILLNDQTAVVSLVYPHTAGAAYDNIPFTAGVYSPDKDLLWKQQGVYAAVNEAQVTQMKHALARVKFVVKCDDPSDTSVPDRFTGTGAVTSVSIADANAMPNVIFEDGVLDLSFTAPASPVRGNRAGGLKDETAFTLSTTGHTADFLTLPIAAMSADLVGLYIRVDGQILSTSLPAAAPADKWEAGSCYTYTVTVKNKGIEVTSSTVDNWTDGAAGGSDVEKPAPPAVGDYYYSDGTTSKTLKPGKTVEGVVFWVNDTDPWHFKAAAIKEEQKAWSTSLFDVGTGAYSGIRPSSADVNDPARLNGRTNREILGRWIADVSANTTGKTIADFPAFEYCDGMGGGSGWYLPAINELQCLCCVSYGADPVLWTYQESFPFVADAAARAAFNALFTAAGGDAFGDELRFSSTEEDRSYFWSVYFSDGYLGFGADTEKVGAYKVRCIREIVPLRPAVKDYYYSDGTFSTEFDATKTAEGVIFWVDPDDPMHYKAVSLEEGNKNWGPNPSDFSAADYAGIREKADDVNDPARQNGRTNRGILGLWIGNNPDKTIADFPAFKYCDELRGGNGWYLPALNELQHLYCAFYNLEPVEWAQSGGKPDGQYADWQTFNALFTAAGGPAFDFSSGGYYWTSTESNNVLAFKLNLGDGGRSVEQKDYATFVRCIKEIN